MSLLARFLSLFFCRTVSVETQEPKKSAEEPTKLEEEKVDNKVDDSIEVIKDILNVAEHALDAITQSSSSAIKITVRNLPEEKNRCSACPTESSVLSSFEYTKPLHYTSVLESDPIQEIQDTKFLPPLPKSPRKLKPYS
jgi:hypothetical protein